jgi:hypothetical protein
VSWALVLYVGAALLAGFMGWGVWLLRQNVGGSMQRLALVRTSGIPALAEECRRVVRAELKTDLDPRHPDAAARALDELVLSGRLRPLFKAPGYELRYAEPVGALLGEMIRRHTGAEWMEDVLGPRLVIHRPGGITEIHPFTLAVRHHTHGRPGQLHAFVMDVIGRA